jgi:hypothetical protein
MADSLRSDDKGTAVSDLTELDKAPELVTLFDASPSTRHVRRERSDVATICGAGTGK